MFCFLGGVVLRLMTILFKPSTNAGSNRHPHFSLMNFGLIPFSSPLPPNCQGTHFCVYSAFFSNSNVLLSVILEKVGTFVFKLYSALQFPHTRVPKSLGLLNLKAEKSWFLGGPLRLSSCDFGLHLVGFHITVHLVNYFLGSGNSVPLSLC